MLLQAANLLFKALLSRYSGYLLLITTLHQKPHFLTLLCSSFFHLTTVFTYKALYTTEIRNEFLRKNRAVGEIMNIYQIMFCLNCRADATRSSLFAMGAKIVLQLEFQMERCTVIKQETDNPILFKLLFFTVTAKIS